MPTIVSKFGGSSTANADSLLRILHILHASPDRRYVVLSAPGKDEAHVTKVTSMLEECWRLRDDDSHCAEMVRAIARRYGEITDALGIDGFEAEVEKALEGALANNLAHVLSLGEYLCAKLFARVSRLPLVDAKEVVRFDAHGGLDLEATLARFRAMASEYGRAVIPGYYGADSNGCLRVFPRNGSDISGALVAAGVSAVLYENWTDVPGLMTADPAIVPNARLISQVSYRQMRALARAGAHVLHPACLDPVAMTGIPTRLRCTTQPVCFGTLIDEHVTRDAPCVISHRNAAWVAENGDAQAIVSVFGVNPARVMRAAEVLHPHDVEITGDCVRVFVRRDVSTEVARTLHRRLIEDNDE